MSIESNLPDQPKEVVTQVAVTFHDEGGNLRTETLTQKETEGFLATVDDQLNEED